MLHILNFLNGIENRIALERGHVPQLAQPAGLLALNAFALPILILLFVDHWESLWAKVK